MRFKLFPALAVTAAVLTAGLIVFGAIVRVTDSGLGCGNQWPLCRGSLIPPFDNINTVIEWLHRVFAVLIGVVGLGMLAVAIRSYRKANLPVLIATVIAAVLYAVQSSLGGRVVVLDLNPSAVTLHLGTAMLLLAALMVSGILASYRPRREHPRDTFTMLVYVTTALAFIVVLSGALVRGSGATLACTDWPLCNGEVLPFSQGPLAVIHVLHRLIVVSLGIALIFLVASVFRNGREGRIRSLTLLAGLCYLAQAGIGAMFVQSAAAPLWGAAHVGMAAATWALLVIVSTYETLSSGESRQQTEWQRQSEPLQN